MRQRHGDIDLEDGIRRQAGPNGVAEGGRIGPEHFRGRPAGDRVGLLLEQRGQRRGRGKQAWRAIALQSQEAARGFAVRRLDGIRSRRESLGSDGHTAILTPIC